MKNWKSPRDCRFYLIKNSINGLCYIGVCSRKDIRRRWSEHKKDAHKNRTGFLYDAIREYGIENFNYKILEEISYLLPNQAIEIENSLIKKYITYHPYGYNEIGGELTREISEKKSNYLQGRKFKNNRYTGVWSVEGRFRTEIRKLDQIRESRSFNNETKAAIAYDKCCLYVYGNKAKINFESKREKWLKSDLKRFFAWFSRKPLKEKTSIIWDKSRKKWQARLNISGKIIYLGRFGTKEEAIAAKREKMSQMGLI